MQVRHQSTNTDISADCYPTHDDNGHACFRLRLEAGKGRGGFNEPSVTAEFSARELRDFAVDLLSLVAVEESRV